MSHFFALVQPMHAKQCGVGRGLVGSRAGRGRCRRRRSVAGLFKRGKRRGKRQHRSGAQVHHLGKTTRAGRGEAGRLGGVAAEDGAGGAATEPPLQPPHPPGGSLSDIASSRRGSSRAEQREKNPGALFLLGTGLWYVAELAECGYNAEELLPEALGPPCFALRSAAANATGRLGAGRSTAEHHSARHCIFTRGPRSRLVAGRSALERPASEIFGARTQRRHPTCCYGSR